MMKRTGKKNKHIYWFRLFLFLLGLGILGAIMWNACANLLGQITESPLSKTETTAENVNFKQGDFQSQNKTSADMGQGHLILINSEHAYQSNPNDSFMSIYEGKNSSYYVKDKNVLVTPVVVDSLNAMFADFQKSTGNKNTMIISGVRDIDNDSQKYEIYYKPATGDSTAVPLPENNDYALSGNNVDGFIVTEKMNN